MRDRRIIVRAMTLLLLGAIVNVAVAWGCSFASLPRFAGTYTVKVDSFWPASLVPIAAAEPVQPASSWAGAGVDESDILYKERIVPPQRAPGVHLGLVPDRGWPAEIADQINAIYLENCFATNRTPRPIEVIDIRQQLHQILANQMLELRVTAGWPLRAVRGWIPAYPLPSRSGVRGVEVYEFPEGRSFAITRTIRNVRLLRGLPYSPVWPGFAINTIFYAAILWLLWIAPGKVRRFVRVRRNRCPACGFIIAPGTCANGLCSECGAALPQCMRKTQ